MQFSLEYRVLTPSNPRLPLVCDKEKTVTLHGFAASVFEAHAACALALKGVRWHHPESWKFAFNNRLEDIPLWILKFEESRISSGWGIDDGPGVKFSFFYVVKPFTGFTPDEVSRIESEAEDKEELVTVTQYRSMPSAGVLWDTQYDLVVPVQELSQFTNPYITTYTVKEKNDANE